MSKLIANIALLFFCLLVAHLPCCAQSKIWAIQGKAVTDAGIKEGYLVIQNGVITSIGADESEIPATATKVQWDGYIFPGLIDTHNHGDWNFVPQWTNGPFSNRYVWQKLDDYNNKVTKPHDDVKANTLLQEARKYGEMRALIGGTTMIQGSYSGLEPDIMVRNLDARYKALNYVPNIAEINLVTATTSKDLIKRLDDKVSPNGLQRIFFHIAEGSPSDTIAASEFAILSDKGFKKEGVVVIHGLACKPEDFKTMAENKMYLVWSPVSNWNLYRSITDIPSALKAGVVIALAPDWTISGSDNLLEEMKFAYAIAHAKWGDLISAKDIFKMATSNAATVSGVDKATTISAHKTIGPMGTLQVNGAADLFLAPILDAAQDNPYESLLRTYPKHVHLVFIDGKPVYGDRDAMSKITSGFDELSIQGVKKAIVTTSDDPSAEKGQQHLSEIETGLHKVVPHLAPLVEN